jgi:hypothetical protein
MQRMWFVQQGSHNTCLPDLICELLQFPWEPGGLITDARMDACTLLLLTHASSWQSSTGLLEISAHVFCDVIYKLVEVPWGLGEMLSRG